MLLEISDVDPERNASNLRHCTGRITLEKNEEIPEYLSATTIVGASLSMHAVVSATSVHDGCGLLVLNLQHWWMNMNYAGAELSAGSYHLRDGRVSDTDPQIYLFVVE